MSRPGPKQCNEGFDWASSRSEDTLAGDDRVPLEPLTGSAETYQAAVMRALARDPEERFAGASEMRAAILAVAESN